MNLIYSVHMEGGERLEHIARVRSINTLTGAKWEGTRADAIFHIDNRNVVFYGGTSEANSAKVEVVHVNPPYIRTLPDLTRTDNLLMLPRF